MSVPSNSNSRLTDQPESMPPFKPVLDKQPLSHSFWWVGVNYLIRFLLIWSMPMPSYAGSSRDLLTTGICQVNRTLHLTTNSTHRAWLISCSGLPNMWALVNCSTNTCQSGKGWLTALKQQGEELQLLELPYLHFTGGLEDAWKTVPQVGVKIKMASQFPQFLIPLLKHKNVFITGSQCQTS